MPNTFIHVFYRALFTLLITIGWQQTIIADTAGHVPAFAIVSTSSPNFSVSSRTRISWLLEDININSDAPFTAQRAQELVRRAIAEVMLSKGLPVAPSGSSSDYYIAYTLASESTLDDGTLMKRYNISPGFNPSKSGANVYEKGTLLIHIIDANTRQTVWQSVVQANIQSDISEEQRKANIRSVVQSMLKKLPVTSYPSGG
ncbi:MAG: DUF4136 domain-containing protein [Gammaproteobacteria bacterium]|nr:DUF4136 domain-containing protein [Gammaproteobacteria bacterium]